MKTALLLVMLAAACGNQLVEFGPDEGNPDKDGSTDGNTNGDGSKDAVADGNPE